MPRDGSGQYSQPFPIVVEDTTIESTVYNGFTTDVAQDLNDPRPIVAGGTAATSADQALFNLAAEKAAQVVTNYDSHLWVPGSFRSATTATGGPVVDHAFAGVCYINEALANPPTNQNVVVEAVDTTDPTNIVKYIRVKTSGTWGLWTGVSSGSAAASIGEYTFNTTTTFPPAAGQIRLNNATQNSATEIFISHTTALGSDATNLIPFAIRPGSDIAIQDKDEIAKYKIFTATASPVLSGGDYRVTATFKSGGTDIVTTQRVLVGATVGGVVRYDAAQTLSSTQQAQARTNIGAPFRSYIAGLTLSTAGSTATFGVSAGQATDSTNLYLLELTSAYTKTTAAWAVGTGVGSLDTGTIAASTWYHTYIIKRPDTGVVDVLLSWGGAPPIPTLPTNYTLYRRIGSMLTNASTQWSKFVQDGDAFTWDSPLPSVTATNPGIVAVLRQLHVPPNIRVEANVFTGALANTPADQPLAIYLSDPSTADVAPNVSTFASVAGWVQSVGSGNVTLGGMTRVWTNTSSQIRTRLQASAAGTGFYVITHGWRDPRGRDA